MKFGLVHYNAPGDTVEAFLDYVAGSGFEYIEMSVADVWPEGEEQPEQRAEIVRKELDARGLKPSALNAGNDFILPREGSLATEAARMQRVAGLAQTLGTNLLRIDAGWPREPEPEEKWLTPVVAGLQQCLDFAEKMDIRFALDNHGITTNRAEFQLAVLEQVGSARVGLNLDTMNYRWFGHELATIDRYYEMVAPYVFHVHLKDGHGSRAQYVGTALGDGEINLDYAVSLLKQQGYQGVWCVEYEGPRDQSADGYRKGLAWMRTHIAG
jgi:sugar phosphate isomerase/epimerase